MAMIEFAEAPVLKTPRLKLRAWCEADIEPYIAMGRDLEVMKYFPGLMSREETRDHIRDLQDRFRNWGFGYWAIESAVGSFAGFAGLSRPKIDARFTPCVEIGWRLARWAWGQGFATEAAMAALKFGFEEHGIKEIVAMVSEANVASCRVAERIGMTSDPADNFEYPEDWAFKACVLYRIKREKFMGADV